MKIDKSILDNLLRCNKHIQLGFIEDSNLLEIKNYTSVICTINLYSANISDNADIIYHTIINLDDINLYIPKIYQP